MAHQRRSSSPAPATPVIRIQPSTTNRSFTATAINTPQRISRPASPTGRLASPPPEKQTRMSTPRLSMGGDRSNRGTSVGRSRSTTVVTDTESRFYPFSEADLPFHVKELPQDWAAFDRLSQEEDYTNTETLKGVLDSLLIFATLFSAINAAILAFTLPLISGGSPDRTNELLELLIERQSATSTNTTPSTTTEGGGGEATVAAEAADSSEIPPFTRPDKYVLVNYFITMSLTLSLVAAFVCVLGQQWIIYYRHRNVSGPDSGRWERLRRARGMERWKMAWVIRALLPTALQIAVIFFLNGFLKLLSVLDPFIGWSNIEISIVGAVFFLVISLTRLWDPYAPYRNPYSSPLQAVVGRIPKPSWLKKLRRQPESEVELQARGICWVFESTGKDEAFRPSAWNITTIEDKKALKLIYKRQARKTIHRLWVTATDSLLDHTILASDEPRESDQKINVADAAVYSQADIHMVLSVGTVENSGWFPSLDSLPAIAMDRGDQRRLIWRAALACVVDYSSPNNIHPKLRPRYVGMCTVALLMHRLYCDARSEERPEGATGEDIIRTFAFEALADETGRDHMRTVAMVGWAMATIPRRWPERHPSDITPSVLQFKEDFAALQRVYTTEVSSEVLEQLAGALETYLSRRRSEAYGLPLASDGSYVDLLKAVNESVGLPLAHFAPRLIPALVDVLRTTEHDALRVELLDLLPKILDGCSSSKAMRGWNDATVANVSAALGTLEVGNGNSRVISSIGSFTGLMEKNCGERIPGDVLANLKATSEKMKKQEQS